MTTETTPDAPTAPKTYQSYRIDRHDSTYKGSSVTSWLYDDVLHGGFSDWGSRVVDQAHRDNVPGFHTVNRFNLNIFHDLSTGPVPRIGGEVVNGVYDVNAGYQSLDAVFVGGKDADIHDFANWELRPKNNADLYIMSAYKFNHTHIIRERERENSLASNIAKLALEAHILATEFARTAPREAQVVSARDKLNELRIAISTDAAGAVRDKHFCDITVALANHPLFGYDRGYYTNNRSPFTGAVFHIHKHIYSRNFTPDKTAKVVDKLCERLRADETVFLAQFDKYGTLTRNPAESRFLDEDVHSFAAEIPGGVKYKMVKFAINKEKVVPIRKLVDEVAASLPRPAQQTQPAPSSG